MALALAKAATQQELCSLLLYNKAFHQIFHIKALRMLHRSVKAVSFLFWSYASQHPVFQQVALSSLFYLTN
jgi:hypothetical protein